MKICKCGNKCHDRFCPKCGNRVDTDAPISKLIIYLQKNYDRAERRAEAITAVTPAKQKRRLERRREEWKILLTGAVDAREAIFSQEKV